MENTLDADIANAIDQISSSETEEVKETDEAEDTSLELEAESEDFTDDDDQPEGRELTAPISWKAEEREYFNTLDDKTKEYILNQHDSMYSDYQKKTTEVAQQRKQYEAILEAFAPIRNDFMGAGMDDAGAIRFLTSAHQRIMQNPHEGIAWIAQQYGIDLSNQVEPDYDYEVDSLAIDPRVDALQKEIDALKNQAKQSETQRLVNEINDFKSSKDEYGNLKNPFFDQVGHSMLNLLQSGAARSVDQAYKMAVAADPELSAKQLQLVKENEAKFRKQAAKRAKKAASGVKGSSATGVTEDKPTDIRSFVDTLIPQF